MSTNSRGYLNDDREFAYRYGEKMDCPECGIVPVYYYDDVPRCTHCFSLLGTPARWSRSLRESWTTDIPEDFSDPLLDELADTDLDEIVAFVIDLPEPAEVIPSRYDRALASVTRRFAPMLRRRMKAAWV